MGLFKFSRRSKNKENPSSGNEEDEINLFEDDISSGAFLEKVRELKDINKKFQNGINLLHLAVEYGELELAKELIALKINVNEKNDFGNTPLWIAVFNCKGGRYDIVDLLIANGADPLSVNHTGKTPLDFAETTKNITLIQKLSSKKKSP